MSRIFDALQRSGTEQSGIEYPDMVSVATEVFEAPRRPESADQAAADQVQAFEELTVQGVAVQEPPVQRRSSGSVVQSPVVREPMVQADTAVQAPGKRGLPSFL